MDWDQFTINERLAFCRQHFGIMLATTLPWADLSPTTQLLLKSVGITSKAVYEA